MLRQRKLPRHFWYQNFQPCRACSHPHSSQLFLRPASAAPVARRLFRQSSICLEQNNNSNEQQEFEAKRKTFLLRLYGLMSLWLLINVWLVMNLISQRCEVFYPFIGKLISWKEFEEYLKRGEVDCIAIVNNQAQICLKRSFWSQTSLVLEFSDYEEFKQKMENLQNNRQLSRMFKKSTIFLNAEKKAVLLHY